VAASAALILEAILARVIEPGVRVEKIMLTANTPALRLSPQRPARIPLRSSLMEASGLIRIAHTYSFGGRIDRYYSGLT
jgi:hypothetical protein